MQTMHGQASKLMGSKQKSMNLDLNDEVNYGEAERGNYEPIKNLEDADVHINAKEFNLAK